MATPSPLVFTVRRNEPRLVVPAKPTPRELKQLSDIDDQGALRFQLPVIMFYKSNPSMEGKDPVKVIREALAKALVFYYPFAGRLIEGPNRKLIVDCTGEGVLFIEADADVKLDQLGDTIRPKCPCLEELLHDVPGSEGIVGCPLLLTQVTRFSCGGFSLALRVNHTMSDGSGFAQFLNAIAEFAQGVETAPSVPPVWERELLTARKPPSITCHHHEYDEVLDPEGIWLAAMVDNNKNMIHRSFFFGPKEIKALRNHLPPQHCTSCTTFEVLTACLWRCRTSSLGLDPNEIGRVSLAINGRWQHRLKVPVGYYGNVFACPAAVSKAEMLSTQPLEYAVELVKKAKAQMNEEYLRSLADLTVTKGRPLAAMAGNYFVSDTRHLGIDKVDFGWGEPLYGGPARAISLISFYTSFKDSRGGDGIVVPICLPQPAMEKFEQELKKMIN